MPSEIDICNLALSHIGRDPIQSLQDAVRSAQECKLLYPRICESVLRDHAWNFATKRAELALLDAEYAGWDFAYQWPSDCLRAQKIWNPNSDEDTQRIPFEVAVRADLLSRVILTDQEDALLFYTARVTNPNVFDVLFVDAVAYRLAAELTIPLRGDPRIQQAVLQTYSQIIGSARVANSNEKYVPPDESSSLIEARS